jgi:hypothetical protein
MSPACCIGKRATKGKLRMRIVKISARYVGWQSKARHAAEDE